MSSIPHAFNIDGAPGPSAPPAEETTSDAELTAVAAAHKAARMLDSAMKESQKGKAVEKGGTKNGDPNKPTGVTDAQWNQVLTSGGLPSNIFAQEKAIDAARWAGLDAATRNRSVGLRQQIQSDFSRLDAATTVSGPVLELEPLARPVETPPPSPTGLPALHTPSSANRSITRAATAPAVARSSPLPSLPVGSPVILPTEQAVATRLHLEVPVELQSGKEIKETPTKGASRANSNILVLGRHLLQLKDTVAELDAMSKNSDRLASICNAKFDKLQEAMDLNSARIKEVSQVDQRLAFPANSPNEGLRDILKSQEDTNAQVEALVRDLANLFRITDAEFKKVWPAVNTLIADVRQGVEDHGAINAKLGRVLVELNSLKATVEGYAQKPGNGGSNVATTKGLAAPHLFSFSSPFPPALETSPSSSSLGKRGFDTSTPPDMGQRGVLIMSPVIMPVDRSQILDAGALFELYRKTVIPTYAPPAVVASFEDNNTALKVIFPSESFVDVFIPLWNNSPKRLTDSLRNIKLTRRYKSVFPADEDVGQGYSGFRGGGAFRGTRGRGGRGRGGNNMQFFR